MARKRLPKNRRRNVRRSELVETDHSAILTALLRFAAVYLLFVAIFLVWREGYGWFLAQNWFDLRTIDMTGNARIEDEELRAYSRLDLGTPIFDIDVKRTAAQVEAHPWIKHAYVARRLPDTLLIEVEEYAPAGLIALDRIYYVYAEGIPFTVAPEDVIDRYVVVEGLKPESFEVMEVGKKKVRRALELIEIYNGHPLAAMAPLKGLLYKYDGLEVHAGEPPTRLMMGKGNLQDALDRALKLWRHIDAQGRSAEVMHLDNRKQPERVSVQLRPLEPEEDSGLEE